MKKLLFAITLTVLATNVQAGGYKEPKMEPEIVIEETAASSGSDDWVGVLMTFLTIVLLGVGS